LGVYGQVDFELSRQAYPYISIFSKFIILKPIY